MAKSSRVVPCPFLLGVVRAKRVTTPYPDPYGSGGYALPAGIEVEPMRKILISTTIKVVVYLLLLSGCSGVNPSAVSRSGPNYALLPPSPVGVPLGTNPIATPQVYFDSDIRAQIIKAINSSTETIDIAMYRFTDKKVIEALRQAKDKVTVRVILGYNKDRNLFTGFKENEEINPLGGRKSSGLMHHKFIIFDGKRIMIGSYNISGNAHKRNCENAIFLSDPTVIKAYQDQFDNNLWDFP